MFNKPFSVGLRAFHVPIPHMHLPQNQQQQHQQLQGRGQLCISAAQAHLGPVLQILAKTGARWGGSAVLFAGAAYALAQSNRAPDSGNTGDLSSEAIPWIRQLAEMEGVEEVLSPGQQLRQHPVGKLVVEQDHLVRENSGSRGIVAHDVARSGPGGTPLGIRWKRLSNRH